MSIAKVISIATADLGYTECIGPGAHCPRRQPGCNHTVFGARFGLDGEPWCAIYTWDLWTRAGYGDLVPKTAGAWDMLHRAEAKGWALPPQTPQVGDIPVYSFGDGHIGGVVTEVRGGGYVAIEGNTSKGNRGSQTNGWYVARRFRTVQQLKGLIRLPVDSQEDDMPLTSSEIKAIAREVWAFPYETGAGKPPELAQDRLVQAARGAGLAAQIQALRTAVAALAAPSVDVAALAAEIVKKLPPGSAVDAHAVAVAVCDEQSRRLTN